MAEPWVIVAGDFRVRGGMDRANYQLARYLAKTDRQVHLVAHSVDPPLDAQDRVRFHRVPRPLGKHLLGAPLLARAGSRVAATLTRLDPETRVIVNGGNCPWPGINWVHMVHHACPALDHGAPLLFRLKNGLTRLLNRRDERLRLPQCPFLIANSERTKRDLSHHLGIPKERIHVVYLGTDAAQYAPLHHSERQAARARLGIPEKALVLLFVGALGHDRNKGFDTVLAACQQLRDRPDPVILLAAGEGALPAWQARVDAAGLGPHVRLLGYVSSIPSLMSAADLFISPTRYDAYGLAVHESLCRGLPALVSRAAGVSERYPEALADLLIDDPDNPHEVAHRIRTWLALGPEQRQALALFSHSLRSHTWEDMAAQIVEKIETHKRPLQPMIALHPPCE